jgi:hypothetical protein
VSGGVVVASYAQLTTEGYLTARHGSGTRVATLPLPSGVTIRPRLSPPDRYQYELRPPTWAGHSRRGRLRDSGRGVGAAFQGGQSQLELIDPVPEYLQLGGSGQAPLRRPAQPR